MRRQSGLSRPRKQRFPAWRKSIGLGDFALAHKPAVIACVGGLFPPVGAPALRSAQKPASPGFVTLRAAGRRLILGERRRVAANPLFGRVQWGAPARRGRPTVTPMLPIFHQVAGVTLVVAGVIITPTPIPFGLIMLTIGLALLAPYVKPVQRAVRVIRRRWPHIDEAMRRNRDRFPPIIRQTIDKTHPDLARAEEPR